MVVGGASLGAMHKWLKAWSLHLCGCVSFDPVCREYGTERLHLNTPYFHFAVALTPDGTFAKMDHSACEGRHEVKDFTHCRIAGSTMFNFRKKHYLTYS